MVSRPGTAGAARRVRTLALVQGDEPGRVVLRDVDLPPLEEESLRLRVLRAGVCASDLAMVAGGDLAPGERLGHELVAEVEAAGSAGHAHLVGSRVSALAYATCGRCGPCVAGWGFRCAGRRSLRQAFGRHAVVPASACHPVPPGVPLRAAALAEPLAVALHAVGRAGGPGSLVGRDVLVLGAGPIGLLVALWAGRSGARRVVSVARSNRAAALATGVGVRELLSGDRAADRSRELLGGGAPVVFDCVGASGSLATAIRLSAPDGLVVVVGVPPAATVPLREALLAQLDVRFSVAYTTADFVEAVALLPGEATVLSSLVTTEIDLEEVPAWWAADERGAGKVLVRMSDED